MKKILMFVLALAVVLSITACGEQTKQPIGDDSSNVQIANPFIECETLDNAAEIAGFSMSAPSTVPDWVNKTVIEAVENDMIQIFYIGAQMQELRVSKADINEDISGVFDSFDEIKNIVIDDRDVTLKFKSGKVYVAIWTDGGYSYAVSTTEGLEQAYLENLISNIK